MKLFLFLSFLLVISFTLFGQSSYLKTGFYRAVESDSCQNSPDYLKISDSETEYCISKIPIVTKDNFISIKINTDTTNSGINYIVGINLDNVGAEAVKEATAEMIGEKAVFIINNKVMAAPTVRDRIDTGYIAVFCNEETIKEIKKELQIK